TESAAKFSGGSFSNYLSRPRYQLEAVPAYLEKLGNQHQGLYNAQGRGFPDLSAQALGLKIVVSGNDRLSSSTGTTTAVRISLLTYV
ncbi:hypothetical protein EI94DRAFT_1608286, partial [Lactarius quietus]